MADEEYVVSLDVENWARVLDAARKGDMGPADKERDRLRSSRVPILNAMSRAAGDTKREVMRELLVENRRTEEELIAAIRLIADQSHQDAMVKLAETSNGIAEQARSAAEGLKRWTQVLAVATVILALATVALIFATLSV